MTSYPTREFVRPALPPAVLAAIVLVAGAALTGSDVFLWILFPTSILALIVCYFVLQARQWWWLIVLVPIAVIWNPVLPFPFGGTVWTAAQFVAALAFITVGVLTRVRGTEGPR